MKFQRNLRIFRGQLDAAPIASVFFLLLFFVVLQSFLVYRPGVKIALAGDLNPHEQIVRVDARDRIAYKNLFFKEPEFGKRLRDEAARAKAPKLLSIRTEPGTRTELVHGIRALAAELNIPASVQKYGLDLPEGEDLAGTANPRVVVAVSHNQQFFFQNQNINFTNLASELGKIRAKVQQPLTIVLDIDKSVPHEVGMDLAQLAGRLGYDEILFSVRPKVVPLLAKPGAVP